MRVRRWLPAAVSALVLLMCGWNAFSIWRLNARITAFERALETARAARVAGEAPPVRVGKAAPAAAAPIDVHDPEIQEQIALLVEANEHRKGVEKKERLRESIRELVARYGEEEGLDSRTIDRVLDELDHRSAAFDLIREDVRTGALSGVDARHELDEIRAASDAELERILGKGRFEELTDRLWGDRPGPAGR